jgi:reactive intermediate/imine deaminase
MHWLALAALPLLGLAAAGRSDASDSLGAGPHRQVLAPSPSPLPVFSPAVRTGNLIFLSGQLGNKPGTLELVPGGIGPETEQTLTNIKTLLEQIGLSLDDVVKCTVFLADIEDFQAMNEVYARFFPKDPPARSALAASGLALGARTEIECIAAAR